MSHKLSGGFLKLKSDKVLLFSPIIIIRCHYGYNDSKFILFLILILFLGPI